MICGSGDKSFSFHGIFTCAIIIALVVLAASSASAATITVPAGGNLQSAINAAQPGDTIVLDAGATYTGDFVLPNKSGSSYITIQSSRVGELPEGVRVGPAQSGLLARLHSASSASPIIRTAPGAHHYRLIGLEITTPTTALVYDLVRMGEWFQTSAEVPHDFVIDRSYIHGHPTQDVQRGIALNGAEVTISNSYISEIHGRGYDTQAICGWNGPGPFRILNNYLEAAGENILFGGADPSISNLVPTNIEIRGNHLFKPLTWKVGHATYAGIHWGVKNLLEIKMGRNVIIDGNVLENCWGDAQIGYAVLFTVRNQDGKAPWAIIENLSFTNNIIKNSEQGIQTLGMDSPNISQQSTGLLISNNLFLNVGHWFTVVERYTNVTIEHNTHFQGHNVLVLNGQPSLGFIYRNNLTVRDPNGFGVFGGGIGEGTSALNAYCPSSLFAGNIVVGAMASIYPSGNFFPATLNEVQLGSDYRLLPTSPYKNAGTDGKDPGVDVDALNAALLGVAPPTPTPTPNPTPTPTATPTPTSTPTPTATPTPAPFSSVTFVGPDTTTKGSWKNIYGGDGYNTVNDVVNYPTYAQVSVSGNSAPTWASSTSDPRALQKSSTSDRVAARWESNSTFTINLNLTDGLTHRVAIYVLDWDGNNRAQRIEVVDSATNVLLDSRTVSSFNGGQYLVWDIRGPVKMVVTKTGAKSAVVSGIYFGNATPTTSPSPSPSPTPTPVAGAPRVTLTVPTDGSTFVAGMNITVAATATDADGSISKVEFFKSGVLIGTDTTSPYSMVWTNAEKGTHQLTAKATDNTGLSTTSSPVSITVTNSPNSVNRAKGRANNLVTETQAYAGASDGTAEENATLASDLAGLTAEIETAYSEFQTERSVFGSGSTAIDAQIRAASLFSKATAGLAMRAALSPNIKNNLLRIATHLAIAEDLMRYKVITSTTATQASTTNTRTNVIIGQASTGYGTASVSPIAPASLGTVWGSSAPMTSQTAFAALLTNTALPYELGGLSVTVAGVAVPVIYASPSTIKFYMPTDLPFGTTEVIISSQDGYICQGVVTIEGGGSRIMTIADNETGAAIASNGITAATGTFDVVTPENFGSDKRTRLTFFATGVSGIASNADTSNDVTLGGKVVPNYSESVYVVAQLSDGRTFYLPIEFAGSQGRLPGLDQITIILIPDLKGAGTVKLKVIVNSRESNLPTVFIR